MTRAMPLAWIGATQLLSAVPLVLEVHRFYSISSPVDVLPHLGLTQPKVGDGVLNGSAM